MIRNGDDARRQSIAEAKACDVALRERRYLDARMHLEKSKRLAVLAILLDEAVAEGLIK